MSRRLLALATGLTLVASTLALAPRPAQAQPATAAVDRAARLGILAALVRTTIRAYRIPRFVTLGRALGGDILPSVGAIQGFLFRFQGGAPGWQQLGLQPNWDTEILVSSDGRQVVQVVFNQPPGNR